MLQRLYDWTMEKAAHRHAVWYMCVFAFAESTFFPFPADILMVPMILANRDQAWRLALFAGVSSALGGVLGYAIGFFLFEEIGRPILDFYGYMKEFGKLQEWYRVYGELIVAVGGLTPIPYKAVTITSGVAQMDFWAFTAVSFATRLVRFFAVAAALYVFGPPIKRFMDNNLKLATFIFLAIFIGGFVAIAYLT